MSKIKNSGIDQYDVKPFEQQQFGTSGVEGVKCWSFSDLHFAHNVRDECHENWERTSCTAQNQGRNAKRTILDKRSEKRPPQNDANVFQFVKLLTEVALLR